MELPREMTAIEVEGGVGPASALKPVKMAVPRPGPGQILIRVGCAGVNRPDLMQRQGAYAPPPGAPTVMGLEVAGEVVELGEGAARWKPGDQVCALLGGGGYAEYAVVDARHALPIPKGLDLVQAAALPETVFTVYANAFDIGGLQAGQTLLLHGATSGIGVMAIQMAKVAGARVITTSRGAKKAEAARGLGADIAIDSTAEDFVSRVRAEGGADLILDMVGGDFVQRDLDCLKTGGMVVMIAVQAGSKATLDLARLMVRRQTVTGSTLRPRDADEKARLALGVEALVWPWIEAGKVRPVIDKAFPLADAGAAQAWLEADQHVGKVMLVP